jgi:membrane-bound inhibitor of C-type lysozyme
MRSLFLLAATTVLAGGCAQRTASGSAAGSNAGMRVTRYTCAGGVTLSTFARENGDLNVEWAGRTFTLVRTQSGVGEVWTDGNLQFRTRGQDVYLEERGQPVLRDCQVWR